MLLCRGKTVRAAPLVISNICVCSPGCGCSLAVFSLYLFPPRPLFYMSSHFSGSIFAFIYLNICCVVYSIGRNHSYNDKTVPPCLWFESNIRDMYKYSLLSSLSVTFYPCCLEPISKMWDSNQTLNVISLLSGALAASDNWGSLRQNLLNWSAPLDNNTNNLISSSFDIFRCANISNTYPSQPSVSR